jgi:hypothetical protein
MNEANNDSVVSMNQQTEKPLVLTDTLPALNGGHCKHLKNREKLAPRVVRFANLKI